MKFTWIQTEKASYPLTKLCRWLGVTPSGFYAWRQRPESTHAREDRRLKVLVQASFAESKQRYGSPRLHADLIEQDEQVSRKRVIRLMQENGLKARTRKRFTLTTMSDHDQPVAANLLDRQFEAAAPNQRWVGDTTEFVIDSSGKLYLAVILDLFSRFVVGWAVSAVNDRPPDHQGAGDGTETTVPGDRPVAPLRPGLHVRERGLPGAPGAGDRRFWHAGSRLSSERYEHDGERIRGRRTTRHNGRKSLLRRSRSGPDWFDDVQVSVDQQLAQLAVGSRGTEEHAIGHDRRGPPTYLQHPPVAMSAELPLSSPEPGRSVGPDPQTERGDAQQQHASNHRRTPVPGPDPSREHHETDNGTKRRYGDR